MKQKVFFRNLDGLRFLCFLSVFFFHSFYTEIESLKSHSVYRFFKKDIFGNGNLGVNFFFVLSGFLITYLLILEKRENGQIDLKSFWIRRILRIWPLFYFCVCFGFIVFPLIKQMLGQVSNETANPVWYLTFLNNFDFIRTGSPDSSVLGVLWSVAVEEQFYLFWPLILYVLPVRSYWIPFLLIIVSSLVFRAMNDDYLMHEHHTLSCIGDMTIGSWAAWLYLSRDSFRQKIAGLSKWIILCLYLIFALIFFFRDEVIYLHPSIRIFERALIAVVIALIILEQNFSERSFFKMGNFKRISELGKITYGLYCLHFIGILITIRVTGILGLNGGLWQVMLLETAVALVLSIVIAKLSYRFYESPFLRLKDRFSYFRKD